LTNDKCPKCGNYELFDLDDSFECSLCGHVWKPKKVYESKYLPYVPYEKEMKRAFGKLNISRLERYIFIATQERVEKRKPLLRLKKHLRHYLICEPEDLYDLLAKYPKNAFEALAKDTPTSKKFKKMVLACINRDGYVTAQLLAKEDPLIGSRSNAARWLRRFDEDLGWLRLRGKEGRGGQNCYMLRKEPRFKIFEINMEEVINQAKADPELRKKFKTIFPEMNLKFKVSFFPELQVERL